MFVTAGRGNPRGEGRCGERSTFPHGRGMLVETKVMKAELLDKLRENRDKHRGVFEAALAGYREEAQRLLGEQLAALLDGRTPKIYIILSRPEDHTQDYDRIIAMLEMEIGETFTLSEERFAQYVMDDWRWKRDWLKMSNRYASASTSQAYGDVNMDDE